MLRMLVCGLAVVAPAASLLLARQGIVRTKDNMTFEGDVTEKGDTIEITGVAGKTGPVVVNRANVSGEVIYPDKVADEIHANLKLLKPDDVATRITMAKSGIENHAYEAACDALNEAARIDPTNKEVKTLLADATRHIPVPATLPTTKPVATTEPVRPKIPSGVFIVKRKVTPEEINRVRQVEFLADDSKPVAIRIDTPTRIKFTNGFPDMKPAEFNKLSLPEQAKLILQNRKALAGGVLINSDPATVLDFKQKVQPVIKTNCATANCHGGSKGGMLTLFGGDTPPAIYTNFVTLQKYATHIKGIERPLVDHTQPDASILLQYLLALSATETPHPDVPGARNGLGQIRSKNDRRYTQISAWIESLRPETPDYGIDLSTEEAPSPPRAGK